MTKNQPQIGCQGMGRVTGIEPATSRITISRQFNKIKRLLNFHSNILPRISADLNGPVQKINLYYCVFWGSVIALTFLDLRAFVGRP